MAFGVFPSFRSRLSNGKPAEHPGGAVRRLDDKRPYTLGGFRTEIESAAEGAAVVTRMPVAFQGFWLAILAFWLVDGFLRGGWQGAAIVAGIAGAVWGLLIALAMAQHKYFVRREDIS